MCKALLISPKDNVAVVLVDVRKGQLLLTTGQEKTRTVCAKQHIRKGHKIALNRIPKGEAIIKYGEVIGYAKEDIHVGEYVHVHNVLGRDEVR